MPHLKFCLCEEGACVSVCICVLACCASSFFSPFTQIQIQTHAHAHAHAHTDTDTLTSSPTCLQPTVCLPCYFPLHLFASQCLRSETMKALPKPEFALTPLFMGHLWITSLWNSCMILISGAPALVFACMAPPQPTPRLQSAQPPPLPIASCTCEPKLPRTTAHRRRCMLFQPTPSSPSHSCGIFCPCWLPSGPCASQPSRAPQYLHLPRSLRPTPASQRPKVNRTCLLGRDASFT